MRFCHVRMLVLLVSALLAIPAAALEESPAGVPQSSQPPYRAQREVTPTSQAAAAFPRNAQSSLRFLTLGALQEAELPVPRIPQPYLFGRSVALSGNTALVAAPVDGAAGAAVYVFTRSGAGWSKQARLVPADPSAIVAPEAVALSGDTALVGGNEAAYVFTRSGTTWSQQAVLTTRVGSPNSYFGSEVAIDGDTALVGAPSGGFRGAVYTWGKRGSRTGEERENDA